MKNDQEVRLPDIFRPILWSYAFEDMDVQKNKSTIIVQAINYGTLEHWKWVTRTYGEEEVKKILQQVPVTAIRAHVRKLVALLFGFDMQQFNYAPRGINKRK